MTLVDTTASAFSAATPLPTDLPMNAFDIKTFTLFFGEFSPDAPFISGSITSIKRVPDPLGLALLALGAGGVAWMPNARPIITSHGAAFGRFVNHISNSVR